MTILEAGGTFRPFRYPFEVLSRLRKTGFFFDERLPENLYVADVTLFYDAMGNPPMLTIMALAKKIAKVM